MREATLNKVQVFKKNKKKEEKALENKQANAIHLKHMARQKHRK